jgi:putative hydrolase of the HAD superfamily
MVRNIVFDMGMVLMDYHPLETCRVAAGDEEGAQAIYTALFTHPEWVRLDDDSIEQDELSRRAQDRLVEPRLKALVPGILDAMPYNILSPIPAMIDTACWTLNQGFGVYLLSNANLAVSRHREIVPLLERFNGVIFSADEKMMKPNPAIYRLLTDRFALEPSECLFIDDNENNIQAAHDAGWQAYLFNGDAQALRLVLEALPSLQN